MLDLLFSGGNTTPPELMPTLKRIERKLDLLLEAQGLASPSDGMDDIRELIAQGQKISAIKLYRERTGLGLAEAKAAVDSGML
ncbi:MAG: ribosomal protein L7/L12 [Phycisphaerales bacterium]